MYFDYYLLFIRVIYISYNMDSSLSLADSKISALFMFILIISGSFLGEIFPCKLRKELTNNMYLKHLFGFFTMIFFVVISSPDAEDDDASGSPKSIMDTILSSSILYTMFILITKIPLTIFYIIFVLLGGTYLMSLHKQNLVTNMTKPNQPNKNDSLAELKRYDQFITYTYIAIFIILFFGVISYARKKKMEYKGKFDYITFFLGKTTCKNA